MKKSNFHARRIHVELCVRVSKNTEVIIVGIELELYISVKLFSFFEFRTSLFANKEGPQYAYIPSVLPETEIWQLSLYYQIFVI